MRGSAARVVVIVAAVIAGVLLIGKGFSTAGSGPSPVTQPSSSSPTPSATATPTPKKTGKPTDHGPTCKKQGVEVAVYNASGVNGIAHATADKLGQAGYVVKTIANATSHSEDTRLYYRTKQDKVEAGCLEKDFFKGAVLQKLPGGTGIPPQVQVAVFVGVKYGTAHAND